MVCNDFHMSIERINILTWNIHNSDTAIKRAVLADIVTSQQIDILVLQEAYGVVINTVLAHAMHEITYPNNQLGAGVRVFLKIGSFDYFSIFRECQNKLVFIHLKPKNSTFNFNIAAVHLYSKVNNTERQQLWKNLPIITRVKQLEQQLENESFRRTILVGDFNQNPYESDLCDLPMINAEQNRAIIGMFSPNPVYKQKDFNFDFWYNPMWNLLGDHGGSSAKNRVTGTYFRYAEDERQMWHLFDGFILRPELMGCVDFSELSIITGTSTVNFLKSLITSKYESLIREDISDHLPVKFSFSTN